MKRKLLFLQTEDWTFWSHRLPLARAARDAGWEVVVAARVAAHGERIRREGFKLVPMPWRRSSLNPFYELSVLARIVHLYRIERPSVVHHVSAKPILYGTLAASLCGVHAVVNALTGLGFVFISNGLKARVLRLVVRAALKLAFRRGSAAIFQNEDDLSMFVDDGLVSLEKAVLIRGSGVDVSYFVPKPEPDGPPLVILPGRLLWDKGVGEFVEAARRLAADGVKARFALLGDRDEENPAAIPAARLSEWGSSGVVECWGHRDDMLEAYSLAHIVCLPSYREGLPKTLMEAAACGRPLVAADVPGCREVVKNAETGLLVPVRDAAALAAALRRLIEDKALRERLGSQGRRLAVDEFSQEKIAERTLAVYDRIVGKRPPA